MKTLLLFMFLISISVFGQKTYTATQIDSAWQKNNIGNLVIGNEFTHTIELRKNSYYFDSKSGASLYIDTILVVDSGKVNFIPFSKKEFQEYTDEFNRIKECNLNVLARTIADFKDFPNTRDYAQGQYDKEAVSKPTFDGFMNWLETR